MNPAFTGIILQPCRGKKISNSYSWSFTSTERRYQRFFYINVSLQKSYVYMKLRAPMLKLMLDNTRTNR